MTDGQQEYDVAIVVFARAKGVDQGDAQDRATMSVRFALTDGNALPSEIGMPRWAAQSAGDTVSVAGVLELGRALGNGYAWASPTAKVFREVGMEKRS